ncbi:MAG: transposase [Acidimicrobiia bacterium]
MERAVITELVRPEAFVPGFCPWPQCPEHRRLTGPLACTPHGRYRRRCDGRVVPRYRCGTCGRTFSQQSFAFSYYLKRPELSHSIARGLVAGAAHRQIARSVGCHHSTVTRRSRRLGRHALLLHQMALRELKVTEPLVVDDFDSYAGSQYFPCTLPTATGAGSWFVYGFGFARERRRGTMSPVQKKRRARLERCYGRPPRGGVTAAFRSLIDALPPAGDRLHLVADDDPAIHRAVASLPRVVLSAHPNPVRGPKGTPRSREARERDAALFPNDQLHRFLRHSQAAHRRETIAFGRSYNGLVERLALFVVWRNLVQSRSERHPKKGTTAMALHLTNRPWDWGQVLARRLQPSRVLPGEGLMRFYRRELVTPHLADERRHTLVRAF